MKIEVFIFIAIAVISVSSMLYIPKEKIRLAAISFFAFQTTTWLTSIILAQRGAVDYPAREFQRATSIDFIPQFIFYPTLFMWFVLLFPKHRGVLFKLVHLTLFLSLMVWFIFFTNKYTDIYNFPGATDFSVIARGYPRNFLQFSICYLYINWFFKYEK